MLDTVLATFLCMMALFLLIGAYSSRRRRSTTEDYLLASRTTGPWFTALAAVATNNSGFMFIGLIGNTYMLGLSGAWIMVGWILGDYLMWFWFHRRLREHSEAKAVRTLPSALVAGVRGDARWVQIIAALITVIFLGTYAAAQLTAGSKALQAIAGWDRVAGTVLGTAIVLVYCFAGGVRASIWVNVTQSVIMLVSMFLLFGTALFAVGGPKSLWAKLEAIDPALTSLFPGGLRFGFPLYLTGWLLAGVGVVGQPHVMLAVLTARSGKEIHKARHIYFSWYTLFSAAAIGVALCCRVLIPERAGFDPELALPVLARQLLPGVLVGVILAGLFSAAMSTADSQLISCSGALTQDILRRWRESYLASKAATVLMTALVLAPALNVNQSVFGLVAMSWSALASALGPLVILRVLGASLDTRTAVGMMITGLLTVVVWRYQLGYSADIYEVLPGMLASFCVFGLTRSLFPARR